MAVQRALRTDERTDGVGLGGARATARFRCHFDGDVRVIVSSGDGDAARRLLE